MLLYDANLSPNLVEHLSDIFPNSQHVSAFGIESSDELIWDTASEIKLGNRNKKACFKVIP